MQVDTYPSDFKRDTPRVVYVVDDDGDLRRSLHFLLETRQICVSPYPSGIQFLNELDTLQPAPIILDIRMPQMDGIQVLAQLRERLNAWPVIILSGHGEIAVAVKSLKSGAVDFLEKPVTVSDLMFAIDNGFERLARQKVVYECSTQAAACLALLTPREEEVIDHLCRGRSNKQVAFDLSISPRTVEMHRANALRQLGVRSVVEAAALRMAAAGLPTSVPLITAF